jgi:hypothetical protein
MTVSSNQLQRMADRIEHKVKHANGAYCKNSDRVDRALTNGPCCEPPKFSEHNAKEIWKGNSKRSIQNYQTSDPRNKIEDSSPIYTAVQLFKHCRGITEEAQN